MEQLFQVGDTVEYSYHSLTPSTHPWDGAKGVVTEVTEAMSVLGPRYYYKVDFYTEKIHLVHGDIRKYNPNVGTGWGQAVLRKVENITPSSEGDLDQDL